MSSRYLNAKIAQDTLGILKQGYYTVGAEKIDLRIPEYVQASELFKPGQPSFNSVSPKNQYETKYKVNNETTIAASLKLVDTYGADYVAALNFASAKHVGGGWLGGASAQEESIARISTLVPTLESQPEYYDANHGVGGLYTDHLIWSTVTVFKDEEGNPLADPWDLNIITSPAPNLNSVNQHDRKLVTPTLKRRIRQVLTVAALKEQKGLVLGAWGCGVFKNDPSEVAELFYNELEGDFKGVFSSVVFAVLDNWGGGQISPFQKKFAAK